MHFMPTSTSWLNRVGRFFRNLTTQRLRQGIFTNVLELIGATEADVNHHNKNPKPFIWTATVSDILQFQSHPRKSAAKFQTEWRTTLKSRVISGRTGCRVIFFDYRFQFA